MSGTLLAEDVDLFGLYDAEGALVWGALPEQRLASFSVDADALEGFLTEAMARLPRGEERASGIASVSGRAAYYTVKPIIYELYGAGVVGYLAMLRFIDGTEIARWENLVGGVLNVVPTTTPRRPTSRTSQTSRTSRPPRASTFARRCKTPPESRPFGWRFRSIMMLSSRPARASAGR